MLSFFTKMSVKKNFEGEMELVVIKEKLLT